jgi:catechol 2,3-dioxygenase-like lactoylglutathione lyase family enzyme
MEQLISKLIQDFEEGKTSRRQLVRALAVAAGAAAAISATEGVAVGAEAAPLQVAGINHISYQVQDYAKSRDFYVRLFGAKISNDTGKQCNLAVGGTNMIVRNGTGATPTVDHIAYSIANWTDDAIMAELKRHGLDPKPEGMNSFQVRDPDGYHVQLSAAK